MTSKFDFQRDLSTNYNEKILKHAALSPFFLAECDENNRDVRAYRRDYSIPFNFSGKTLGFIIIHFRSIHPAFLLKHISQQRLSKFNPAASKLSIKEPNLC